MRLFFQILSYLFHPILIPVAGAIAYFMITPKYSPLEFQAGNILPIFILTVIIPILSFFILRNIGVVSSIGLPTIKERMLPMLIHLVLLLMILYQVIPNNYTAEIYFYFVGLVIANLTAFLLLLMNYKISLHMLGLGCLLMFLICLSIHFEINITIALSAIVLVTGLVATARLYLKAHSRMEVMIGLFIGIISQLLTVTFWL
ncbi:MAG: hypothetical protein KJO04_03440 [Bacteroidia bacterium]|nr:hypothetical protein [Bacteroidia bacterium]